MMEVDKTTADVIAALLAENDALRAALAEHGYGGLSETKANGLVLAASQPAQLQHAEPSDEQVAFACLTYRHDFGLISEKDRAALMFEAREWLRAWQKEIHAISKRMDPGQ